MGRSYFHLHLVSDATGETLIAVSRAVAAQYQGVASIEHVYPLVRSSAQLEKAIAEIERLKKEHEGTIVIDHVIPDYHAMYPKACMGGWGKRTLNVTPKGKVLPCHAAETIPGLEFWNVQDHSIMDIWRNSPAFNTYRGTDWMKEPCLSCARKTQDFGGCRCQALALTGDAANADPVCHLSPHHGKIAEVVLDESHIGKGEVDYVYRRLEPAKLGV